MLFAKMVLIARSRNLEMKNVLKYCLRPFPLPLATCDGNLVKTAKAKLLNIIEAEVPNALVTRVVGESALIVDAMAILQTLNVLPSTFGELAKDLLVKVINMALFSKSSRVDFVCDRYPAQSIKNLEREKRGEDGALVVHIYGDQQRVTRQWKKFMSSGENKEEIMKFIFNAWRSENPCLLKGVEIFLAHEDKCHKLSESEDAIICSEVEELACDHEEADTRMIAHAKQASLTHPNVIIKSPDTDVFFIALNGSLTTFADVFFETGTQSKRRIISLSKVKQHFGRQWCSAFIGFHAFTGQ
jgi:hypothetical protein